MNNSGNIFANEKMNNSNMNCGHHSSHSSLFNNRVVKSNENFDNNKRYNDIHSGRISNQNNIQGSDGHSGHSSHHNSNSTHSSSAQNTIGKLNKVNKNFP
jgi:hypothetical protein